MSAFDLHRHPGLEDWLRWLEDPRAARDADAMDQHARACAECRNELALLRDVQRARRVRRWSLPPDVQRARARRFPGRNSTPRAPRSGRAMPWLPSDVRADALGPTAGSRIVSAILDDAELSVLAVPPRGDGPWHLEGRVWLRKPSQQAIQLVLRHDDHILARRAVSDGDFFEIEDVVGPGWVLEVHLPGGPVLTVEDPGS